MTPGDGDEALGKAARPRSLCTLRVDEREHGRARANAGQHGAARKTQLGLVRLDERHCDFSPVARLRKRKLRDTAMAGSKSFMSYWLLANAAATPLMEATSA